MNDTYETISLVKLIIKTQDQYSDEHYFTVNLKNPKNDTDTLITSINDLNQSLAGGLSGMWLEDKLTSYKATKIKKAILFEKAKTTSADGSTVTTFQKEQTFYKDPNEYQD